MLVAWSAIRSRWRTTKSRWTADGNDAVSLCMKAIRSLYSPSRSRSTASSESRTRCAKLGILTRQRIQAVVHHGLSQLGEARDVQNRQRWLLHQRERPLGDMCGQVAHTFQVVIDFDGCGQEAHVSRHGLVQRHQTHGEIVDLDLQGVDIGLACQHLARAPRPCRPARRCCCGGPILPAHPFPAAGSANPRVADRSGAKSPRNETVTELRAARLQATESNLIESRARACPDLLENMLQLPTHRPRLPNPRGTLCCR